MDTPLNIVLYHCVNLQLFKEGRHRELQRSRPGLRIVAAPCSGKLEAAHMLKSLAGGADGVLILACEKEACKFFEGSARASKRMEHARLWLDELGIDNSRLALVHATPRNDQKAERILDDFLSGLTPLVDTHEKAESSGG